MATTPRGYPYPGLSDSPNGPSQIQGLATAIDTDVQAQVDASVLIAAKYKATATQSIAYNTNTKITLGTAVYNLGSSLSITGNNTININKTGLYAFGGGLQMAGITGAAAVCYCWIGLGTSTAAADRFAVANQSNLNGALPVFCLANEMQLSAGQSLSLYVWHNQNPNVARDTAVAAELQPNLWVRYIAHS